ncbi:hypothetical protein EUTSA_v10023895mg [Eutrema salsugineum]|uniref:NAC domain-containing protein n=1 Tax=Eutrema salsugineum TaxID=72664 RepID=V4MDY4_EUTSA|nr:hypothetical protein EUTSA_v10023895mg [Eutrema salsugineum]
MYCDVHAFKLGVVCFDVSLERVEVVYRLRVYDPWRIFHALLIARISLLLILGLESVVCSSFFVGSPVCRRVSMVRTTTVRSAEERVVAMVSYWGFTLRLSGSEHGQMIGHVTKQRSVVAPRWSDELHGWFATCEVFELQAIDRPKYWPSFFVESKHFYGVVPWRLMYGLESSSLQGGRLFLVNRTENCGRTDGCDGGCWRIMRRDKVIISEKNKILGFKRVFKFCESDRYKRSFKLTWIMEEYRLAKKSTQGKVLCRIKLLDSTLLRKL